MRLAGVDVRDADALALALVLRHEGHTHTADQIESACLSYQREVVFDPEDRDAVIAVLLNLDGLASLRGTLMLQREWQRPSVA